MLRLKSLSLKASCSSFTKIPFRFNSTFTENPAKIAGFKFPKKGEAFAKFLNDESGEESNYDWRTDPFLREYESPFISKFNQDLSRMKKVGRFDTMKMVFEKMKKLKSTYPDAVTYAIMINAFSTKRDIGLVEPYIKESFSIKGKPHIGLYNSIIRSYARCGQFDKAIQIFEQFPSKELKWQVRSIAGFTRSLLPHQIPPEGKPFIEEVETMFVAKQVERELTTEELNKTRQFFKIFLK